MGTTLLAPAAGVFSVVSIASSGALAAATGASSVTSFFTSTGAAEGVFDFDGVLEGSEEGFGMIGLGGGLDLAGVFEGAFIGDFDLVEEEDFSEEDSGEVFEDFLMKTTWLPSFLLCSITF